MSRQKEKALDALARRLMADRAVIPEGTIGSFAVKHRWYDPGAKLLLVPMRTAFHTGLPQMDYVCRERTLVQSLTENDGTWMTDLPCEMVQMHDELARRVHGRVLVGGLGLGILPRMLLQNPRVTSVAVSEINASVVSLVAPTLDCERLSVAIGDVHELDVEDREYDFALLDTWQSTGEMTWTGDVVPLRRKMRRAHIRGVRCWHEDVMLSQVVRGIFAASAFTKEDYVHLPIHYYAFVKGLDQLRVERQRSEDMMQRQALAYENAAIPMMRHCAYTFTREVGHARWEHWFGHHWDEKERGYVKKEKEVESEARA